MNIDGIVFWDHLPTSDEIHFESQIAGREIFDTLHRMLRASVHGFEEIECFLANASEHLINSILADAHVNVGASIELDEQRKHTNAKHAKELIILTLIKRGHSKWVSQTYIENN